MQFCRKLSGSKKLRHFHGRFKIAFLRKKTFGSRTLGQFPENSENVVLRGTDLGSKTLRRVREWSKDVFILQRTVFSKVFVAMLDISGYRVLVLSLLDVVLAETFLATDL